MASRNSNLVTHTIPNLVAGVSQQFTEARFETQVEEMENCVPSIARGVIRRNPASAITHTYTTLTNSAYVYTYDRGTGTEQYAIEIDGNGNWYVHNVNTGALVSSGYNAYFTVPAGSTPKNSFEAVTIGDYTFIANKTKTVTMNPITAEQSGENLQAWQDRMVHWIKKTTAVQTANKSDTTNTVNSSNVVTASTTNSGIRLEGYDYTLKYGTTSRTVQGLKDTRSGVTQYDQLQAADVAAQLAAQFSGLTAKDTFLYGTNVNLDWSYEDSFGNEASLLVHKVVDNAADLPAVMPITFDKIVKISGAFATEYDDYWMKYSAADKEWAECVAPDIETELNPATMPHVIVRKSLTEFVCTSYDYDEMIAAGIGGDDIGWKSKKAGDDVTLENPSFIGKQIVNIFFHKNRLGFLTKESIILSETADYGNFFATTAQVLPDDDPIDLFVATTDVTVLRDAVSTAGTLILFSDDSQFVLTTATNGPLTPSNATINTASNYTYSSNAAAVANKVYFISESGGYSQLFAYRLTEGLQTTEADHLTSHIPSYIPQNVSQVVGHSTLGYVFVHSEETPNTIYVLNTFVKGGQDAQNAFHKWTFGFDVIHMSIINNKLILHALEEDGSTELLEMSLEIPGDITAITYQDEGYGNYTSSVKLSKFHVKDAKGNGTNRGRTQIRTIQMATKDNSRIMCSIYNRKFSTNPDQTNWMIKTGFWADSGEWVDTNVWKDAYPLYIRNYYDDDTISVMSNSNDVQIEIKNNDEAPTTGFELSTVDIEALFFQRAMRM